MKIYDLFSLRTSLAGVIMAMVMSFGPRQMLAADQPVKREMRSAWVATVWRLDWPSTVITSTGNTTQINKQKQQLTTLLDSMAVNNMNAVNFQVRSRADAMYKSSYEPWSSDLVDSRGMDPGYDPLAYCIEECHKRGMECHAWINPYRFESVTGAWSNKPGDYRKDHPDWVMDVKGASILNPGKPEVTQRICDIIREICTNYDIDGILFDDYFYLSGTTDQDADLYKAYTDNGGKLSLDNWRRDNVNRMVDAVYRTIKEVKPWLRFGISPAGIACTDASVARKYGITPCPTGSDWQYKDIYSDPIAWLNNRSLDFISPQIYWTIGHSTDYDQACQWWSVVANKFGRHFYSSHSISSLTGLSQMPGMSNAEASLSAPVMRADGPNNTTFAEFANQVRLNRRYTLNDAPGSIFYSAKFLYKTAPLFAHYLHTTVFNTPALVPAMTWQPVNSPGNVSNVRRSGNKLTWQGVDNVRYTIYAVPESEPVVNFDRDVQYLLGTSYVAEYQIPADKATGYKFAVCVLDRYGNEYSPIFVGAAAQTLPGPTLTYPADGQTAEMPFDFKWENVDGADRYIIDIADKNDMSQLLYSTTVTTTSANTSSIGTIPSGKNLYWRVRSCGTNCNDGLSRIQSFRARNVEIISPANGDTALSLTPTVTWTEPTRQVTIQIARDDTFSDVIYTAESANGSHTVAPNILGSYETYFLRLLYTFNGRDCTTATTVFTTAETTPATPLIAYPSPSGTLHSNEFITVTPIPGLRKMRIELARDDKFNVRASYISENETALGWSDSKNGSQIKVAGKSLEDGKTYYLRVRGTYNTSSGLKYTDYSAPITITYSATTGSVSSITAENNTGIFLFNGDLILSATGKVTVAALDMTGRTAAILFDGINTSETTLDTSMLHPGIYIVSVNSLPALKYVHQ